jgi:tRNA modification GTPase
VTLGPKPLSPGEADTIVAPASPSGRGARAVVRLSGARAHEIVGRVFRHAGATGFACIPGVLELSGWPAIEASLWLFRAPRSYTGEDAAELHVPGSPPLVHALVRELARLGAREAQPGEFTRRAFLRGRLDLAQAEAVLGLTRAESAGEVRAAARALLRGLGTALSGTKERVLEALAHVEAAIDFPDEELPGLDAAPKIARRIESAARDLSATLARTIRRTVAGPEAVVVLAGLANAGKSTLLNALAGREAALVSPAAGTTRDPVSAVVDLGEGRLARVMDTAGEKPASGEIERAALERTRELVASSDALVYLVDLSRETAADARGRLASLDAPSATLLVGNKVDLVTGRDAALLEGLQALVSAHTGAGLAELRRTIARALEGERGLSSDLVQTARQAGLVERAREALERAARLLDSDEPARFELAALDLREALDALGELTGALVTDDLLDKIFGEFCIGK